MSRSVPKLMAKLQNVQENTLTKNTIIPLMEKLGFCKVEFHGGVNEEGKDIICWEKDRLENVRLVVSQVKHFKFTNSQSDYRSFNNVVNQLSQCFNKPLPYIDKKYYSPYEAYLISTFPIDSKTLITRFSEYPSLADKKIHIIDGYKLSELIIDHLPVQASEYLDDIIDVKSIAEKDFNNKILLKALGFQEQLHLKDIYTDIDFSLGKSTTKIFFSSQYNPSKQDMSIDESQWNEFSDILQKVNDVFGSSFISPTLVEVERRYSLELDSLKEWEIQYYSLQQEVKMLEKSARKLTTQFKAQILVKRNLEKALQNNDEQTKQVSLKKELVLISKDLISLEEVENRLARNKGELSNFSEKKPKPIYKFTIDGHLLYEKLSYHKNQIEKRVREINKAKEIVREIREFLENCNNVFESANHLLNNKIILHCLFGKDKPKLRSNFSSTILKLPIDFVFKSGLNITLLGEAGAGKTTSLQIFAYQLREKTDKLVIWAPLPKVLRTWSENRPEISDLEKMSMFETALLQYLNFNDVKLSDVRLREILNNEKVILLFDSVDEAIRYNEWLPEAISQLAQKYSKNLQIIVTSRLQGKYIDEIPFFTITLMPFSRVQRNSFIKKWFGNNGKDEVNRILEHLQQNRHIDEITRTPLLATALCVLAKNRLTLPQTEIKLFNDRIKLLTGYYDSVKQIQTRITISPQDLETLAKKIAYHLHLKGKREADLDYLISVAKIFMQDCLSKENSQVALEELIDPCNVLVPMNDKGEYGFGHLRFQEHLSAMELNSNRSINILPFLKQGWWYDTLILFSQNCDNLIWLVNLIGHDIIHYPKVGILADMFKVRPVAEQIEIKQMIENYKSDFDDFQRD